MRNLSINRGSVKLRLLLLVGAGLACATLYWAARAAYRSNEFVGVNLTGIQHIGPNYNIGSFYVDGYDGVNVGRGGGGGSDVCCVRLPRKWRPGLSVDLRWAVGDWSKEIPSETEAGNFSSIKLGGAYRARVPVEKYTEAEHLFVHFFPGGRARVVSSFTGRGNPEHPIQDDDPHAADNATVGTPVDKLFTAAELAEMDRKFAEDKKRFGDWR